MPEEKYDERLSNINQIAVLTGIRDSILEFKAKWPYPISAWDEIYNYISVLMSQDRHLPCDHGTIGCTTRHKKYDTCSDDPNPYSN